MTIVHPSVAMSFVPPCFPRLTKRQTLFIVLLALAACVLYVYRNFARVTTVTERNQRTSAKDTSQVRHAVDAKYTLKKHAQQIYSGNDVKGVKVDWGQLGTMAVADGAGWSPLSCNTSQALRRVDLPTQIGNLSIYVYGSASEDLSVTARAMKGQIFERGEISRFLELTSSLPLIDVGANVGLVALQAALQGRQVVALEPVPDNAVRLCRAAIDFGHARLLRVIQNAVSDTEGPVTLAMDMPRQSTRFTMSKGGRYNRTSAFSIKLDRVIEVLPFNVAALKIDVEGYEGHVLSGAERLFQQVAIPLVWLEWFHVQKLPEFGAQSILDFMHRHKMKAYDLMSDKMLDESKWDHWPFTVLWKKEEGSR